MSEREFLKWSNLGGGTCGKDKASLPVLDHPMSVSANQIQGNGKQT